MFDATAEDAEAEEMQGCNTSQHFQQALIRLHPVDSRFRAPEEEAPSWTQSVFSVGILRFTPSDRVVVTNLERYTER